MTDKVCVKKVRAKGWYFLEIPIFKCRVCKHVPELSNARVGFYPKNSCTILCSNCIISVSSESRELGHYGVTEYDHYKEAVEKWNNLMEVQEVL